MLYLVTTLRQGTKPYDVPREKYLVTTVVMWKKETSLTLHYKMCPEFYSRSMSEVLIDLNHTLYAFRKSWNGSITPQNHVLVTWFYDKNLGKVGLKVSELGAFYLQLWDHAALAKYYGDNSTNVKWVYDKL